MGATRPKNANQSQLETSTFFGQPVHYAAVTQAEAQLCGKDHKAVSRVSQYSEQSQRRAVSCPCEHFQVLNVNLSPPPNGYNQQQFAPDDLAFAGFL